MQDKRKYVSTKPSIFISASINYTHLFYPLPPLFFFVRFFYFLIDRDKTVGLYILLKCNDQASAIQYIIVNP